MLGTFDDDVLQDFSEKCFDGALPAGIHFQVVGNGALLVDLAVCLREHGPGGVAVLRAAGLQLLERLQSCDQSGELVLARTHRLCAPLVLDACAGEFRLAGRTRDSGAIECLVRATQSVGCGRPIGFEPIELDAHILDFDLQLGQRLEDAIALRRGALERVTQGRRAVDRREHFAARGFDVSLEPLYLAMANFVR